MSLAFMPMIDQNRCTGCRECVQVCPTGALEQRWGKAALVFPEQCTYCTACEDICPVGAIELPFFIVMGESRETTKEPHHA
jgi:NAD-dependent dihydropyrimidine dehydrogenase PreA subunit